MVERMRRLRMSLASSSPGASGDTARPNYVGPSGNGLVERMKAGESPWDQGRSNGHPCPFPEGGPEDEGKRRSGAPRGAPVRVMDRQFPPAGATGLTARRATGCGVPRPRISALRFPLLRMRRVRNRQFGTTVRRDASRGNSPARLNTCPSALGRRHLRVNACTEERGCPD